MRSSASRGKDVEIIQTGDNAYRISIPEFIYLGYANPHLSVAKEENGALSWATPEINTTAVFEEILSDQAVDEHINGLRSVLEDQAESFYRRVVEAIDPRVTLAFEFEQ